MIGISLLIIDDDQDDFFIVKSLLEDISRSPLDLDWAATYEEGEIFLRQNRHSICLMDYRLGAKDGIALLKRSAELGFTAPIILLTGMHERQVDIAALEAGAVDYLVKDGLSAESLARSIRYALGRREMELERIERLRAEAENRSKSEFLAHLSHELRTPLSAILGFTEILMASNRDQESLSQLNIVHRNGRHLLGLLNDILDLSKIEAGKLELEIQPVHFIPFLTDIYALMTAAALDKNLDLNVSASTELPHIIQTDPTRLRQVLLNILGNAIKFTQEGSVNLNVGIDNQSADKDTIKFSVTDTGIGINKKRLSAIFQPFVQVKNRLKQPRTGTGLGLTISKQLIEHLGGSIHAQSKEGVGSCFTFSIDGGDLTEVSTQHFALQYDTSVLPNERLPQFMGRILVVDDLRDMRTLIGHYVSRCGPQVAYASNGEEAIRVILKEAHAGTPFDLVLMDIHMPILDGIGATKYIRELGHTCPLIALTAAHMKGDHENYIAAGFTSCLSKPIDQAQMLEILKKYLRPANTQTKQDRPDPTSTIMVVEDATDTLNATCGILELIGWSTIRASDGKQALQLMQDQPATIALIDLNLPDIDGYELSAALQTVAPSLKIIIASGQSVEKSRLPSNVIGSLLKPITLDQLKQALAGPSMQ